MILKRLSEYIQIQQRVEEGVLLKKFRLSSNGLTPFIEVLIRSGHVQKTINNRGDKLAAQVFYSWSHLKVIPTITVI